MRNLWKPRLPELPEACASCPFRGDNDEAFGAVVERLCKAAGVRFSKLKVHQARRSIQEEATMLGEFACHGTVYNADMSVRPVAEHRQCAGASAHFRAHDPAKSLPPPPKRRR